MASSLPLKALALTVLGLVLTAATLPTEICVGVVLPVTGDRNVESLRTLDAIRMAAEDISKDPKWLPNVPFHVIDDPVLVDSSGYVQFGAQRMYDQVMNRRCANGTAPIAIVGDLSEAVCHQMAPVATLLQVPMISPGARDPSFSSDRDANAFTMVFRSSLGDEAEALKAFIRRYGWTSFVLWHSDSVFGTALTASMAGDGLEMVDVPVPASDQGVEMQRALTRIMTLRFRIIVVHMEDALAKLAMNLSNREGLLNGDYIFLGTMQWTYGSDTTAATFNDEESKYMQGVIGLGIPIPSGLAVQFTNRLALRAPLLYPPYFPEGPVNTRVCGYDALFAVAAAVKNLTAAGMPWTGKHLMDTLIGPAMSIIGVTGNPIQMTQATGSRVSRYLVTNFQNGAFQQVGVWAPSSGLVMTPGTSVVWPGFNYEANPSQDVPRTNINVSPQLPPIAVTLAVIYGFGSLLLHYLIYINTNHEVIKASSPIFCHIILFGGDVAYLMAGVSALSMQVTCSLVPSLIAICFSLIFGALLAKTYRIHRIFNSSELRIKTPTNTHLFIITGTLVLIDVIVISIWMGTDQPNAAYLPSPQDVSTAYQGCQMKNSSAWTMALFLPKAVVVVVGAWLAYKVRDLNHNFNEARYISLSLYNVLLLSAILFGLVTAFPYAVDVVYMLKSAGSASVAFLTMIILFAPKFWDMYITKDWIDYHSNSSYVSGVLVHKSSKGSYAKHVAATGGKEGTELGPDGKPVVVVGGLTGDAAQREQALVNGSPGAVNRRTTTSIGAAGTGGKGSHSGNSGNKGGSSGHHHGHKKTSGDAYVVVTPSSKTASVPAVGGAAVRAIGQTVPAKKNVQIASQGRSSSPTRAGAQPARSPGVGLAMRTAPPVAAPAVAAPSTTVTSGTSGGSVTDREGMVTVTIETPLVRGSVLNKTDTFTGEAVSTVSSPITRNQRTSPVNGAGAVEALPLLPLSTSSAVVRPGTSQGSGKRSPTNASTPLNASAPAAAPGTSSPGLDSRRVVAREPIGEPSFSSSSSSLGSGSNPGTAPGTAPAAVAAGTTSGLTSNNTSGGRSPMAVNVPIIAASSDTKEREKTVSGSDAEAAAAALPQLSKARAEPSRTVAMPHSSYPSLHLDSPAVLNAGSVSQAAAAIAALQMADRSSAAGTPTSTASIHAPLGSM